MKKQDHDEPRKVQRKRRRKKKKKSRPESRHRRVCSLLPVIRLGTNMQMPSLVCSHLTLEASTFVNLGQEQHQANAAKSSCTDNLTLWANASPTVAPAHAEQQTPHKSCCKERLGRRHPGVTTTHFVCVGSLHSPLSLRINRPRMLVRMRTRPRGRT